MYEILKWVSIVLMWAAVAMNLWAFFRCQRTYKQLKKQPIEYCRLFKIAYKMHLWIFHNTFDEQKAYDECGLTDEENYILGYGGSYAFSADLKQEGAANEGND